MLLYFITNHLPSHSLPCYPQVRDKEGEFDDWFESDGQRELRQIFQGQGQIHDVLRDLNKKVDEVRITLKFYLGQ